MPFEYLVRKVFSIFPNYCGKIRISKIGFFEYFILNNKYLLFFFQILKSFRIFLLNMLVDIVGLDYISKLERFHLYYNLLSLRNFYRIFFHISTFEVVSSIEMEESKKVFSLSNTKYLNYSWLERENWDMFGIFFFGNLDLRRILTDYGFEGFPLRKDFPLTGFVEIRYDDELKSVLYENLELAQEFRFFDFESPWKYVSYLK